MTHIIPHRIGNHQGVILIVAASVTLTKLNGALLTLESDKQDYGKPPCESCLLATNCQTRA